MTSATAQEAETKPQVLLVDDSPDVHRLLRARLKSEEIDIQSTHSGSEAITWLADHRPALILLDLNMPEMDGFEVLRELKDNHRTVDLPVIVLSGLQSPQDKVTAFDLGAVDYITKPFELTELRVRVRSALRLHHLVQMLAQRARIDGLTGLGNRQFFEQRWHEEYSRSSRHARPLSIAMVDIDHFKSVNDTYGHPAGDVVIQGVAQILQRELRSSDVACRYGGEEFVLILPDAGPTDAHSLCDRIRTTIESTAWHRHPERKITVSMGVLGTTGPIGVSADAWVEEADRLLYAAKKAGRNRVMSSEVPTPTRTAA